MRATLADISSNARVKVYPTMDVLQVANAPIFRAPGYEPDSRDYQVPKKGKGKDPERARTASMARAKAAVRDIALCNKFEYFFTWTLSAEFVDRYDAVAVGQKVRNFLKNASYRKGFSYVCVAERHKDGAIHFHGLCNLGKVALKRACNPRTGVFLSTDRGQPVYNMVDWTLGFSTCIPIDENYERTCNYVTKYISKGAEKILGKWYLSSRNLVKHPEIKLIDGGMDYDTVLEDNPEAPIIPLYRDVCMTVVQQRREEHDRDIGRVDTAVSDRLQAGYHQGQFILLPGAGSAAYPAGAERHGIGRYPAHAFAALLQ